MDTKITFQKTSCYFCSEWLDDKTVKGHLLTCGQVLEKCPYNCLSYIQRKNMDNHVKNCVKRDEKSVPVQNVADDIQNERLMSIEENLTFLRKSLNEEIRMRHDLIVELGHLKKRNQITDEWTSKVSEVLNLLQKRIEEEKECRQLEIKDFHGVIDNLLKQFQEIKGFRKDMARTLGSIETKIVSKTNLDTNAAYEDDVPEWKTTCKRLENELERLRFQSSDDINDCVKYISAINDKMNQIEMLQQNQHNITDDGLMHSLSRLDNIETELTATSGLLSNVNDRTVKTDYNVKQLLNTVNEIEDKSDKVVKQVDIYKELVYETKQSLADLEEHLRVQRQFNMITNIRGHLIWRINHYERKLNDAKESEVPLKSPLFSNKHYGYSLRLDVYLNGIGTWKNRNLIACLTVVNGDYDTLLPWPCKLKADIILREQPENLNDATDITKLVITKKRNDRLEYQNQFIHIPHQVINSGAYIRNDSIVLEVKILKTFDSYNGFKPDTPNSGTPTTQII
ncbi:hypothetical protein ACKWTF_007230 [Chironomus riparius]